MNPPAVAAEPQPKVPTCAVCGRTAIGFNYDVLTCEGCRLFFQEQIRLHHRKERVNSCRRKQLCAAPYNKFSQSEARKSISLTNEFMDNVLTDSLVISNRQCRRIRESETIVPIFAYINSSLEDILNQTGSLFDSLLQFSSDPRPPMPRSVLAAFYSSAEFIETFQRDYIASDAFIVIEEMRRFPVFLELPIEIQELLLRREALPLTLFHACLYSFRIGAADFVYPDGLAPILLCRMRADIGISQEQALLMDKFLLMIFEKSLAAVGEVRPTEEEVAVLSAIGSSYVSEPLPAPFQGRILREKLFFSELLHRRLSKRLPSDEAEERCKQLLALLDLFFHLELPLRKLIAILDLLVKHRKRRLVPPFAIELFRLDKSESVSLQHELNALGSEGPGRVEAGPETC